MYLFIISDIIAYTFKNFKRKAAFIKLSELRCRFGKSAKLCSVFLYRFTEYLKGWLCVFHIRASAAIVTGNNSDLFGLKSFSNKRPVKNQFGKKSSRITSRIRHLQFL